MNPRALLLLIAGAACLATSGVAACRAATPPDVGGPTVTAMASSTPRPTLSVADGALPTAGPEDAPGRLRIPALKLDATVTAVGIDPATGDFAVPPSVDRVGWYEYGPGVTATAGSIVIAGHVDNAAQGEGAFFHLGSLTPGDRIYLDQRAFAVVARQRYAKTTIPLDRYFARDGPVRLTLITCGGPFDPRARHYRDNVVVTAAPT